MGRIVSSVTITNVKDPSKVIRCDALVDTGASHMVLPSAWKDRLGELEVLNIVELELADQHKTQGELCGPVQLQVEGFHRVHNDIVFVDMAPVDGTYEPLIGYLVLEQSQAAVDMLGHRLVHVKAFDLK